MGMSLSKKPALVRRSVNAIGLELLVAKSIKWHMRDLMTLLRVVEISKPSLFLAGTVFEMYRRQDGAQNNGTFLLVPLMPFVDYRY